MKPVLILCGLLALLGSQQIYADTLLIRSMDSLPENSGAGLLRPTAGQTMKQVKATFGPAEQEIPWIGLPPISRWVYDGFTVYFEDNLVIHSTVHR